MNDTKTILTPEQQRELSRKLNAQHLQIRELEARNLELIRYLTTVANMANTAAAQPFRHRDELSAIFEYVKGVLK